MPAASASASAWWYICKRGSDYSAVPCFSFPPTSFALHPIASYVSHSASFTCTQTVSQNQRPWISETNPGRMMTKSLQRSLKGHKEQGMANRRHKEDNDTVANCELMPFSGEISSDLYRDQFSRRILNLSSVMFILMFFIDFWGLCDEKIHSRAQLFFPSIFFPYLHVSCPDMIIDIFSESYEVGILNR